MKNLFVSYDSMFFFFFHGSTLCLVELGGYEVEARNRMLNFFLFSDKSTNIIISTTTLDNVINLKIKDGYTAKG